MMPAPLGLLGRKLGMTQVFRKDGRPVPVTVLAAGPCTVVQMKPADVQGRRFIQLGFEEVKAEALTRPVAGHFAKAKVAPQRVLRGFQAPKETEVAVGSVVTVEIFKPGDRVDVTGTSIGKGFQGGVKRWNWKGGPASHGSMSHRAPGSIGSSTNPSRVFRGHHLPGHMGDRRVTTQALEVIQIDSAQHLLVLKGAVPGHDDSLVWIRKSRKPPKVVVVAQQPKKAAKTAPAKAPAAKTQVPAKKPAQGK